MFFRGTRYVKPDGGIDMTLRFAGAKRPGYFQLYGVIY